MAYQLQPGLNIVNGGGVPTNRATDDVFVYPQPSALNYSARPSTMVFGTAPYMAGKGSPAQHIETSDQLRPQSTSQFNKILAQTYEQNLFPLQDMKCKLPLRSISYEPESTRADTQNQMFMKRYPSQ